MAIDLNPIVHKHVAAFNEKRLEKIQSLSVKSLLRRKNPYLFLARNTVDVEELAQSLVAATISSSEETQFGQALENIAIDVCAEAFGGQKSSSSGIDLDFTREERRYLVSIKSGPAWGNSSQIAKMRDDFRKAVQVIRQGDKNAAVFPVNGCCYGRGDQDRGDYRKVCGAAFWELVSGEDDLYQRLMEELTTVAANGFSDSVELAVGEIAEELRAEWADDEGTLDWAKILAHNSS